MPTNLKQLSELLGLSQTTVSRAVNGYPEVAEATRRRVMKAVAETGYRACQTARQLGAGSSNAIGVVWPTSGHPFSELDASLFQALTARAFAQGYHLISIPPLHDNGLTATGKLLPKAPLDGIIVVNGQGKIAAPSQWPLPVVLFNPSPLGTGKHLCVDVDYKWSASSVNRLFLQLGHRRVAIVDDGLGPVDDFLEGFRTAQAEYPPSTRSTQTLFVTTVKDAFNSYRPAASQPTAYFCPNPTVGNAIVRSATANVHAQVPRCGRAFLSRLDRLEKSFGQLPDVKPGDGQSAVPFACQVLA